VEQKGDTQGRNLLAFENFGLSLPEIDKTLNEICSEIRLARVVNEGVSNSEHGISMNTLGGIASQWSFTDERFYKEKAVEMANSAVLLTFGSQNYSREVSSACLLLEVY